jgi:hypothetical protein
LACLAFLSGGLLITPAGAQFIPITPGNCINESLSTNDGVLQDTGTYVDIFTFTWLGGALAISMDSPDFDESMIVFNGPGDGTTVNSSTSEPEVLVLPSAPFGSYTVYATSNGANGLVTGNYTFCVNSTGGATPTPTLAPTNTDTALAPTSTATPTSSQVPPTPTRTPTTPLGNNSFNAADLLRLIEGRQLAGCDLNDDGKTDMADVLIAAQQGFTFCEFNESVDINTNPGDDTIMVVGHSPGDTIVHGTKDPEGNLIDITSLEIHDPEDGTVDVFFDDGGRPVMVGLGPDNIQATFVSGTVFNFNGTIDGSPVNGTADLSGLPREMIEESLASNLKGRTYTEALNDCGGAKFDIAKDYLDCDDFGCKASSFYLLVPVKK